MSREEVLLPKLGESILSAKIVQWFKKVGDAVELDEPLLEVSTDKVSSEIPSPVSGLLEEIFADVDQELDVGAPLCAIETSGERAAPVQEKEDAPKVPTSSGEDMSDYFSPALLRAAREKNVSLDQLSKIKGTGDGGRVTKRDLENYLTAKATCPYGKDATHVKMTGMRKAIAETMVRSFYEAPHASLVIEVDVTDLQKSIREKREAFQKEHGVKLTITSYIAQAITKALGDFPLLNASVTDDTIIMKRQINLGIAVSVGEGVIVPVIKKCQTLSLPEIAKAVTDLAGKARSQTLKPDDVQGGTITMTNFGMSGIKLGTPIIHHPEVAIVGIGAISKEAAVLDDDSIAVRSRMNICMSFDHRVIDGMYGCEFLSAIKKNLESA